MNHCTGPSCTPPNDTSNPDAPLTNPSSVALSSTADVVHDALVAHPSIPSPSTAPTPTFHFDQSASTPFQPPLANTTSLVAVLQSRLAYYQTRAQQVDYYQTQVEQLDFYKSHNEQLVADKQHLENSYQQLKEHTVTLERDNDQLKGCKEAIELDIADIGNSLLHFVEDCKNLEKKCKQLQASLYKSAKMNEALQLEISKLKKAIESRETEQGLQREIIDLKKTIEEMRTRDSVLEDDYKHLLEKNKQLYHDKEGLELMVKAMEQDNFNANSDAAKAEKARDEALYDLNVFLDKQQREKDKHKSRTDASRAEAEALGVKLREAKDEVAALRQALEFSIADGEQLQFDYTKLVMERTEMQVEHEKAVSERNENARLLCVERERTADLRRQVQEWEQEKRRWAGCGGF